MESLQSDSGCQLMGSAIWCLACHNDVVIAGCRDGSIEVVVFLLCCISHDFAMHRYCCVVCHLVYCILVFWPAGLPVDQRKGSGCVKSQAYQGAVTEYE